jgi:hypothetical protein
MSDLRPAIRLDAESERCFRIDAEIRLNRYLTQADAPVKDDKPSP